MRPTLTSVAEDPATHRWLAQVASTLDAATQPRQGDPVDVLNDLEVLVEAIRCRVEVLEACLPTARYSSTDPDAAYPLEALDPWNR